MHRILSNAGPHSIATSQEPSASFASPRLQAVKTISCISRDFHLGLPSHKRLHTAQAARDFDAQCLFSSNPRRMLQPLLEARLEILHRQTAMRPLPVVMRLPRTRTHSRHRRQHPMHHPRAPLCHKSLQNSLPRATNPLESVATRIRPRRYPAPHLLETRSLSNLLISDPDVPRSSDAYQSPATRHFSISLVDATMRIHLKSDESFPSLWRRGQCCRFKGRRHLSHGRFGEWLYRQGRLVDCRGRLRHSELLPRGNHSRRARSKSRTCKLTRRQCFHRLWRRYQDRRR